MRLTVILATAVGCRQIFGLEPARHVDGGDANLADAGTCTSLFAECVGDTLRTCTQIGTMAVDTPCGWGCVPAPAPHCAQLQPTGGAVMGSDVAPDPSLLSIKLADAIVNTDDGSITANAATLRSAGSGTIAGIDFELRGTDASMFRFASLTVSGPITVIGSRGLALVADGAIDVEGVIDATASCIKTAANVGGFAGGTSGNSAAGSGAGAGGGGDNSTGGGGGAYGGNGGNGGRSSGTGALGGTAFGDDLISILAGGGGGGGGGGGKGGSGGDGGGAIELASNTRIAVTSGGGINAGGCGGYGAQQGNGGGGGGAGGTIVLEAPTIAIAGALAVNGGGGGAGGDCTGSPTGDGMPGQLARTSAAGGQPCGTGGGPGGFGGAGDIGKLAGGAGGNANHSGGGGGGVGRIRMNTRRGAPVDTTGGTLSPALTDSPTTCTQGSAAVQ